MDIMKNALMKRKKDLESGFKISLEITPNEETLNEEKEKKMGLAPEVKDGESPKEPKLMPNVEIEVGEEDEEEKEEGEEMDDEKIMKAAMPQLPKGREAMSLNEKVMKNMMDKKNKV